MRLRIPILFLTVFVVALASCSEERQLPNATVIGKGQDCGWLIQFNAEQSDLPVSQDQTYIMVNGDTDYHLQNTEVYLEARSAYDNEALFCTAMGIAYPQIFIEKMEY